MPACPVPLRAAIPRTAACRLSPYRCNAPWPRARAAEFCEVQAPLTPRQAAGYDAAVGAWVELHAALEAALPLVAANKGDVWKVGGV